MFHPLDHVLAFTLAVLFPLRAALIGFRRLQRCLPEDLPRMRRRVYAEAIAIQWTLVLATAALWLWLAREPRVLGLELRPTPALLIAFAAIAALTWFVQRQRLAALRDDEALAGLRARMARLERMLPHDAGEFRRFRWLAFTAGVCEEILYRGYLTWYVAAWTSPLAAAAVVSLIFGIGHAYQGVKGVVQTGLFGAALAAVAFVTGSILPCIALHALMDLHAGHLLMRAYTREAEQRREAAQVAGWTGEGGAPAEAAS